MPSVQTPPPVKSLLSAQKVRDFVINEILTGNIAPSGKIRINTIKDQLGVSLGAVREALSHLAAEGYVTALPQRGYCVASISRSELVELTEARVEIEILCVQNSIANGDLSWETNLVATFHALSQTTEQEKGSKTMGMSPKWVDVHSKFHSALAAGCQNRWLLSMREELYRQSERYRHLSYPLSGETRDISDEHKKIFDAAIKRDPDAVADLIRSHLNKTKSLILESEFLE